MLAALATLMVLFASMNGTLSLSAPDPDAAGEGQPVLLERLPIPETRPDFATIRDVKEKKQAFFTYLLPMVRNANAEVIEERLVALPLIDRAAAGTLDAEGEQQLLALLEKYRVKTNTGFDPDSLAELRRRIDVVPASLIMAQAANESAWGTSRFARTARNFFGIWCFDPGCGVTPSQRDDDLSHEVRKFDTVTDGVRYYLRTINTNGAYRDLRETREALRSSGKPVSGLELAEGLIRYSERGSKYVEEIQAMIRVNRLHEYTLDYAALLPED